MSNKKQVGRPPFNKGANRVSFNCMVKPATRAIVDAWGDSRGVTIDKLVEQEQARLDYSSEG